MPSGDGAGFRLWRKGLRRAPFLRFKLVTILAADRRPWSVWPGIRLRYVLRLELHTTTGRKTGRRHTIPLLYLEDGENFVVVASNGGAPRHPAWWSNLRADPEANVEIGGRALRAGTQGISRGEGVAVAEAHRDVRCIRELPASDGPRDTGCHPAPRRGKDVTAPNGKEHRRANHDAGGAEDSP